MHGFLVESLIKSFQDTWKHETLVQNKLIDLIFNATTAQLWSWMYRRWNISCILIWDLNNCRFASHTTLSFWENEMKILKEEQFLNCIFSKNLQIEIPAFKLLYVMYYKQFSRKKYLNGICHIKAQTYLFLMRQKITDFLFKRINC